MGITGFNFLASDHTVSSQIGSAACATSSWISQTAALCVSAQSSGPASSLIIQTFQSRSNTKAGHFTFDGTPPLCH